MGRSREVDAWFARLDHPLKPEMMKVRQAMLEGDARLGECIKWQCPTFTYEGDLASINPLAQKHVSLLFHTGAEIPGKHHHLEGEAHTGRFMKFMDAADVEAKRPALATLARVWCDWKARAAAKVEAKPRTKAKPTKTTTKTKTKTKTKPKRATDTPTARKVAKTARRKAAGRGGPRRK